VSVVVDLGGHAHTLPGPWHTLADVIVEHKSHRWHWFDHDHLTLRIVDHRIYGGRLFVSSEWPEDDELRRRWSVMVAADNGAVSDMFTPGAFDSSEDAHLAAWLSVITSERVT